MEERKLLLEELAILKLLKERGAMRYSQIQKKFEMNPEQLEKLLRNLSTGLWIIVTTIPETWNHKKRTILAEYSISKRGLKVLS